MKTFGMALVIAVALLMAATLALGIIKAGIWSLVFIGIMVGITALIGGFVVGLVLVTDLTIEFINYCTDRKSSKR